MVVRPSSVAWADMEEAADATPQEAEVLPGQGAVPVVPEDERPPDDEVDDSTLHTPITIASLDLDRSQGADGRSGRIRTHQNTQWPPNVLATYPSTSAPWQRFSEFTTK